MKKTFPSFWDDEIVISTNGVNQKVFHPRKDATISGLLKEHKALCGEVDPSKIKRAVVFVGKFAN